MPDSYIVEHCSPTLKGLKTGNLFTVKDAGSAKEEIRDINRRINGYGLRMVPMRHSRGKVLVYLYRPDRLKADLENPAAAWILKRLGYPVENSEKCVAVAARHLREDASFPHEIGLFLSYPPEDVQGFMDHPTEGVKAVGCWKVYGDQESAERTFRSYRQCTEICRQAIRCGSTLEQLITAEKGE